MQRINEMGVSELSWSPHPELPKTLLVQAREEVVGTLSWAKPSNGHSAWWNTRDELVAEANVAEGEWIFNTTNAWGNRMTIRATGTHKDLATYEMKWTGDGLLTIAQERAYRWESINAWATIPGWKDNNGQPLLRFRVKVFGDKTGFVDLAPASLDLPELSLLTLFGIYITTLSWIAAAVVV